MTADKSVSGKLFSFPPRNSGFRNLRSALLNSARIFQKKEKAKSQKGYPGQLFPSSFFQSYISAPGKPVWMPREYCKFADEAYTRNVIAFRCINMIAESVANVPWLLYSTGAEKIEDILHKFSAMVQVN